MRHKQRKTDAQDLNHLSRYTSSREATEVQPGKTPLRSSTDTTKNENQEETDGGNDFASQVTQTRPGLVVEFWEFLRHNKKWWLTPIILVLLIIGALILLAGTAAAPFIYPLI